MGDFKIFFFECSYVLNRQQLTHWAPRELFPKKKNILLCTVKMMREPGNFPYFSWFFLMRWQIWLACGGGAVQV